jgi:hypothetical protein
MIVGWKYETLNNSNLKLILLFIGSSVVSINAYTESIEDWPTLKEYTTTNLEKTFIKTFAHEPKCSGTVNLAT